MSSLDGDDVKAPVITEPEPVELEVVVVDDPILPETKVAEVSTVETMISVAIDKATGEIVDRLDNLIEQLVAMKTYALKDAERVKGEITSHLLVRNKAQDLAERVRSEMQELSTKLP